MTGSPTLLVDGVDPFAERGAVPSLSCRLFRDEHGRVRNVPSVSELRRGLGIATDKLPSLSDSGRHPLDERGAEVTPGPAAVLITWRERTTPTDPAERAVHHAILRAFATNGAPPSPAELDQVAAPFDVLADSVLARLHTTDVIRLDPDGHIQVAYPFSGIPTRHRVRLADVVDTFAMCAIDALGMPAMLDVDAVITTSEPATGHLITVTVTDARSRWEPETVVAFVGARPGDGPSADSCCDYLNLFTDRLTAQAWATAHPGVAGEILDGTDAEILGRKIFGELLNDR
ncbi:alkylmercury lyase family protein [Lentzea sp. BCCO 10_0061]|uniref:Alkylmercury lyase family protein n=1 Tax=Lentzea sokolovensis TaxID=3095429 RepID=A0ABU4UQ11_9PSEU|nr:alkylmercury lyase family protein [Lentzea sp. BCCO 10_0061]MDX8141531.1 alkylmercury lyase family protein [Lentzea sp. BCCO 10_0061]